MDPQIGEQIVNWTARLAVAAYVVRLLADLAGWPADPIRRAKRERLIRSIWTFGCGVYLLHVVSAFQFVHHWSHAAAAIHTADETAAIIGWRWSGGLWINYAFTLWWPFDVVWSWRRGLDRLPRSYVIGLHMIVGFLMFNAAIVFGPHGWQWAAAVVSGGAIALWSGERRYLNR